jgi:hypothetical protein
MIYLLIKLFFLAVVVLPAAVLSLPVAALVVGWMCFQNTPLVVRKADISPADMERARRIAAKYDPGKAKWGTLRAIVVSQQDVNLLLDYAANRLNGAARVTLQPGAAMVQASLQVPGSLFGRWLNVDAGLRETGGLLTLEHLKIGRLNVPGAVGNSSLANFMTSLNTAGEARWTSDVLKSVKLSETQVRVVYDWRWDLPDLARATALVQADQDRLKAYSERLAEAVDQAGPARSISLAQLFTPMFALAQQRSAGGDAQKENRAAIVTLAFYSNWRGLSAIIPAARAWRQPALVLVTLNGSVDFSKHFLISAAIAAEAGSPLTNVIGLYREMDDAGGGSRFSFTDIAADHAGARFGEFAVKAPLKLQAALAAGVKERDFMPDVSDLPEFMLDPEFRKRYGGIDVPAYKKVMADIEKRAAGSTLFR